MISLVVIGAAVCAIAYAFKSSRAQRGGMIDLAHPVGWRALGDNRRNTRHSRR